jgi:PAS domain S-box-containing protein
MRTRATDHHEPPRLVLRFAVYAGAAVVLAAVGALLLARFSAVGSAEDDLASDAHYIADELGRDDLVRVAFAGRVPPDVEAQLDELLGRTAGARDVARTTLVAPDGRITYSTDHALIGQTVEALGGGMLDANAPVRWVLETSRTRGTLVAERHEAAVAAEVRRTFLTQAALLLYVALIPVFRRVTAELEARNRRLAESEARYRSLMEQASDAIFVTDIKGRLTDVNQHACEMLGYTREDLLERHAMDLMSIADVAALPERMRELKAGKAILVERPVRREDGTFLVGDISAKLLDDGRILTSIRDVTERKRLREAQKLEAVGRFAGGLADDFGELLARMSRHADRLVHKVGADDDLDEIRSALSATNALSAQLRTVGSRQELSPETVDLNALLESMREVLHDIVGSDVALKLQTGADVVHVFADPAHLEQIVVDLVLHARASMPTGGTLTVETANVEFSSNGRSRRGTEGRHVMLAISDTGSDVGDEGGERLGLGLAAVYGVVHQSGGSIGVESEPGAGTTVRIYLPAALVAAATV